MRTGCTVRAYGFVSTHVTQFRESYDFWPVARKRPHNSGYDPYRGLSIISQTIVSETTLDFRRQT